MCPSTRLLAACLALWPLGLAAQSVHAPDTTLARPLGLDFAVPESPAFDLLAVEPSSILRPSSVKEITAAIAGLIGDGTAISLPRQFGVELAPALLIGGRNLSLARYRAAPWLYRLRVSGAVSRPDTAAAATSLALGVRVTIVDRADPRMNSSYLKAVEDLHLSRARAITAVADSIVKLGVLPGDRTPPEATDLVIAYTESPDRADSTLEAWGLHGASKSAVLGLMRPLRQGTVDRAELDALRHDFEDATWNATSFDIGLAGRADATGGQGGDVELQRWAGWATLGLPLGRSGQWLVGLQAAIRRDSTTGDWDPAGTVSTRAYFGENAIKFLLEAQGTFREDAAPVWLASSGGEFRTPLGPWIRFDAGVEWDRELGRNRLVSNVAFGLGLSGLFP